MKRLGFIRFMLLVAVTAAVLPAQSTTVTLTPAPTSLTFSYTIGNSLPAAQTVSIRVSSGTPAFTAVVTGANTQWLTVGPASGNLPTSLTARVNPTSLAVGTYQATITVTATGVTNPLKISVTLMVAGALPTLSVSTTNLSFGSPPLQPPTQRFTLTTTGGSVPFTAASGAAWMTVTPNTGVVLPGEPVTITVAVDATPLVPAAIAYEAKVTITATGVAASNKTLLVDVTFQVNSIRPLVASIWPPSVQVNTAAASVTIFGSGFYSASVVKVGTQSLPTTVVGSTAVIANIPPILLTTPGIINFIVSNPPPGGDSGPIAFTVTGLPSVQNVVNTASAASGAVSPGEVVTLYGEGIGPAVNYSMQSTVTPGFVDTTVGGYTITIDSVAAPILYLSLNVITVQVPYEVTQGANKAVTVSNGVTTSSGTVATVPAAPGVFSLDGSGQGQAAALNVSATNQALSLNGSTSPAKVGDTVIFYITGEGDYVPTIFPRTGLLIPSTLNPLPQMNPLPAVTIGGQLATVGFAGPVVGSLLGILQVNAVVPAGSSTGLAVPVSISIGTTSIQTGITIVVK